LRAGEETEGITLVSDDLKRRVNSTVEKVAYGLAAMIGLWLLWLTWALLGPGSLVLLVVSFIFLLALKVGFVWLIK
jgi:hypothetical protein